MKRTRFLSCFLLVILLIGLLAVPSASALEPPALNCRAALLIDANTGTVIYSKNEHQELYPASLTKIMTSLLVLEAVDSGQLSMTQTLTASHSAITAGLADDGSTADIKEGEVMTVEQYLTCMLVVSANEACNVLAEAVAGSVDAFVERMNTRAQALGCENTHFVNTTGLHNPQHYTSAWDLYLITQEAMKHDHFMRICDTGTAAIPATNLSEPRSLHTTNFLIDGWRSRGYLNKDAHGVKTGHTSDAGYCLVSTAMRGSMHFISVVLGGEKVTLPDGEIRTYSFFDTNQLFNWAFDSLSYQTVLEKLDYLQEVEVALSRKTDYIIVQPAQDVELLLPNGTKPENITLTPNIETPVEAPIKTGDKLGTLTLSMAGEALTTVDLLASSDVEASRLLVFWKNVRMFFARTAVRVVLIILLVLIVLLVGWKLFFGRRHYRYGRSVSRRRGGGYRGRWRR